MVVGGWNGSVDCGIINDNGSGFSGRESEMNAKWFRVLTSRTSTSTVQTYKRGVH